MFVIINYDYKYFVLQWNQLTIVFDSNVKKKTTYSVNFFRLTAPVRPFSICATPLAKPALLVSLSTTWYPLSIDTWAIPAPINPAPRTPTVL